MYSSRNENKGIRIITWTGILLIVGFFTMTRLFDYFDCFEPTVEEVTQRVESRYTPEQLSTEAGQTAFEKELKREISIYID